MAGTARDEEGHRRTAWAFDRRSEAAAIGGCLVGLFRAPRLAAQSPRDPAAPPGADRQSIPKEVCSELPRHQRRLSWQQIREPVECVSRSPPSIILAPRPVYGQCQTNGDKALRTVTAAISAGDVHYPLQ